MDILGIDPSLSSTGIYYTGTKEYWLICSKPTKKLLRSKINGVHVVPYEYSPQTNLSGPERELMKAMNVYRITNEIRKIIEKTHPDHVVLEAVAFNAGGTIDSLAGLNYAIRSILIEHKIPFTVLSPTTVKKYFVGNGGAKKDLMIRSWSLVESRSTDILSINKGDDLADAFAMAHCPREMLIDSDT